MNYDIDMNDESILDTLVNDKIGRINRLNNLLKLLNIINKNTIISIDGQWGCGKTIFVKQIEYINRIFYEDKINIGEKCNLESDVVKKFNDNNIVFYYNAWENDNHIDPLKSIIYQLINDYKIFQNKINSDLSNFPISFKKFFKSFSNDLIDFDRIQSYKDIVEEIYTIEEKKDAFNSLINDIIPTDKRIVLIIDELDRCNPKFAVKLIETIKHFYTNDKIVFLISCNNSQLEHTVSKLYGENFDGYGYLNKVYDLVINIENVDVEQYMLNVLNKNNYYSYEIISLELCKSYNLTMREINRFVYMFDLLAKYYDTYNDMKDDIIIKNLFLPYCVLLKIKDIDAFNDFICGKSIGELVNLIDVNKNILDEIAHLYTGIKSPVENVKEKMIRWIKTVYNDNFVIKSGNKNVRNTFLETISFLGNRTNF